MSKLLSDLPIGSLVKDPNSTFLGSPIVWKVADKNHTGYPTGAITLITERSVAMRAFDAKELNNSDLDRQNYGNNRYSVSNIRQWLNSDAEAGKWYAAQHSADQAPSSTDYVFCNVYSDDAGFLNGFSESFKRALLETTLIVGLNTVTDGGGSETVTDKIFLASNTEVGLANENSIVEGSLFSIFSDDASRIAYVTAEGLTDSDYSSKPANDTTAWYWWLRTPRSSNTRSNHYVRSSGALSHNTAYSGSCGVRPLCNLPSSVLVSDNPDENGIYTIEFYPSGYVNAEGLEIALTKTKEYIDYHGIKVLEASTDNVIDFNTLTEPGTYLIKNAGASTCTNIPSDISYGSSTFFDIEMTVISRKTSSNTWVWQNIVLSNSGYTFFEVMRQYSNSSWGEWKDKSLPASSIKTGTIPSGVSCATPTADAHLANKAYVDNAISTNAMPSSGVVNNFWIGTQSEYDAITTKSATTLYMIKEG